MDWKNVKRELLKNPDVKREYDALDAEFQLASSIIERRLAKGLSQRQLANRIGTKQPVISRLESGESKPTLSLLKRVADALDAKVVVTLEEKPRARAPKAAKRKAS
ncbi:MAG TPA: helix-turn-helix transcriptional regulator [Dehalococcoidia bacterium]|nr:helix-turn-helix transcriptional regulator [Dehalococcoidia bacterium]